MDPSLFVAYTPQTNGVPSESKLATYMVAYHFCIRNNSIAFGQFQVRYLFSVLLQNRQSPGVGLSTNTVTKHLCNLSLDSQKKVTASPEFVPGRGLTGSNSSSPNLFNNSYTHSQENVGGTMYFYVGNATTDTVAGDDGTEAVSLPVYSSSFFHKLYCIYQAYSQTIYRVILIK